MAHHCSLLCVILPSKKKAWKTEQKETWLWQSHTGRGFFKIRLIRLILWFKHFSITRKYKSPPFGGTVYYKSVSFNRQKTFGHAFFTTSQNFLLSKSLLLATQKEHFWNVLCKKPTVLATIHMKTNLPLPPPSEYSFSLSPGQFSVPWDALQAIKCSLVYEGH